ncbi:MAG: TRAP transporter substrate-binding protein [Deltaproteobacteria bacterium]|jgi:TRAP-type C4-dicarboxylate transport system substrate-binding protein|nr:TRAP transporter substrate-binding protein [Deltaproteobacteria bacterium]
MRNNLIVALIAAVFLMFTVPALSSAEVITLTLTDQNPEAGWGSTHALKPWIKKVEEATGGKVKIQLYPSQTLSKGKDAWNAVKNGIADMGWGFHGFWPGMTPLADVVTLPGLPIKNAEKGSEVLWKLYEKYPEVREGFKDNHVLLLFSSAPYHLITTKKQVKTLADLQGMKIRTTGGPPIDQMKALGAVPASVPMPGNYMAMQKGVTDGMGAPWDAIYSFRLYEVAPYFTYVPLSCVYFSISINKNKWNSLSQDIQQAITSVSGLEAAKFFGANYHDSAKQGVFMKAKDSGFKIHEYTPPADEIQRWEDKGGKPVWGKWVKQMEAKGHSKAQEILNTALDLLK